MQTARCKETRQYFVMWLSEQTNKLLLLLLLLSSQRTLKWLTYRPLGAMYVCAFSFYFNAAPTTLALSHRRLHTFRAVSAVQPAKQPTRCECAGSSVALVTARAGSTTIYLISALAGALLAVLARAPVKRLPLPLI
jgi:Na+-transporting methylmalonyl-CoA/oxaloacetate decarboxylase beta subunit